MPNVSLREFGHCDNTELSLSHSMSCRMHQKQPTKCSLRWRSTNRVAAAFASTPRRKDDSMKFNFGKRVLFFGLAYGLLCLSALAARAGDKKEEKPPVLPPIKPLFDFPVRDTSICVGPDKTYYLTFQRPRREMAIDVLRQQ